MTYKFITNENLSEGEYVIRSKNGDLLHSLSGVNHAIALKVASSLDLFCYKEIFIENPQA